MEALWLAFFFAFGAIIASFMGVVAARLYTGASIVSGRSKCDACGTTLAALALIPILSFFISRGKSACCETQLSVVSPLSEVALGLCFVFAYRFLGFSLPLPFLLFSLALLLALVLYDLAHQILPLEILGLFLISSFAYALVSTTDSHAFGLALIMAGALALALAATHLLSAGRVMGLADAPLVFALALLVPGPLALSGFIYSFWIGGVIGTGILVGRARGARIESEVPFAPFLAAGFLLALFSGWNLLTLIGL